MNLHCGLLDKQPERHPTFFWASKGWWATTEWPAEVTREVQTWLAMPGFSLSFHMHTLRVGPMTIRHHLGYYDKWKDDVIANLISGTRDDWAALCRLRPPKGNLPVMCQLSILDDVKAGITHQQIAKDYAINRHTIGLLLRFGIKNRQDWPSSLPLLGY